MALETIQHYHIIIKIINRQTQRDRQRHTYTHTHTYIYIKTGNVQTSKVMHFSSCIDLGAGVPLCVTKAHVIVDCIYWKPFTEQNVSGWITHTSAQTPLTHQFNSQFRWTRVTQLPLAVSSTSFGPVHCFGSDFKPCLTWRPLSLTPSTSIIVQHLTQSVTCPSHPTPPFLVTNLTDYHQNCYRANCGYCIF